MAKELVSDELWEIVESLLPDEPPKPKGGRPRIDDRAALTGILFVLKSGIPWEMLPQEMGCGSGVTCWRRLREWHEAGVWEKLHRVLLDRLGEAKQIDCGLRLRRQQASWDVPRGEGAALRAGRLGQGLCVGRPPPAPSRRSTRSSRARRTPTRGRLQVYFGRGGLERSQALRLAQVATQPSHAGRLPEVASCAPLHRRSRRTQRLYGLRSRGYYARSAGEGGRQPLAGGDRL